MLEEKKSLNIANIQNKLFDSQQDLRVLNNSQFLCLKK